MNNIKLLILNYHSINDSISDPFTLSAVEFKKQLDLLQKHNCKVIALNDYTSTSIDNEFVVALTFDDGNKEHFSIVADILNSYNYTATFFPIINEIDTQNKMNWNDIRALSTMGFDIGSHGMTHNLNRSTLNKEIDYELKKSKEKLEKELNKSIKLYAVPHGWSSPTLVRNAKIIGYKNIVTTGLQINQNRNNYRLHRWNMRNDTSLNLLERIVSSKGKIPITSQFSQYIKEAIKIILGPKLINYIDK